VGELLELRPASACRWDLVALGEVMLRLDPGEERMSRARTFRAWEGGGEYNVARGLRKCFGLRTTVVTALADNPVGRLIEDFILQGGVDTSHILWRQYDGIGRSTRNGLNFTERGFGVRAALGCSDRGHTAVSQLRPGDIDWRAIFDEDGARWFHCGGIFAALSETTADVVEEAMTAARDAGVVVSYDLNFRPSLWSGLGGQEQALAVNRRLVGLVDVLFGNEEDFDVALGYRAPRTDANFTNLAASSYASMQRAVIGDFPNLRLIATSLRVVRSASRNDWGGICIVGDDVCVAQTRENIEILDRVGGGDSFASGFIYGLLNGFEPQLALEYGAAHGALAMTTPGDTSMASLREVEQLVVGRSPRVLR
jgi:2-dehydro-3-deoxygluconokinase